MRKLLSLFVVMFLALPAMAADKAAEQRKIDALLDTLSYTDVIFIRNDQPMEPQAAREHLEEKYKANTDVITAEDFISKIATTSSQTGRPYIIKLKEGQEVESAKWFREKLKEIEAEDQQLME